MQAVSSHSKYLGLPLVLGHIKSELFKFLIHHCWQKVMIWKERLLSEAGKEIMIKAVLQAIPLYVMTCFKLPISVCRRLHGIMSRFWWSNNKVDKTTCLTNQSHLCRPMVDGGLNFCDLSLVYEALLAKPSWRTPTSLLSIVPKARYF